METFTQRGDKLRIITTSYLGATDESYWHNREFVSFVPGIDADRLRQALKSERQPLCDSM